MALHSHYAQMPHQSNDLPSLPQDHVAGSAHHGAECLWLPALHRLHDRHRAAGRPRASGQLVGKLGLYRDGHEPRYGPLLRNGTPVWASVRC